MKKIIAAKIKISSEIETVDSQGLAEGDAEKTESEASGFFHYSPEKMLLTYSETAESGRVDSEIEIEGERVTVRRRGALESELIFEESKTNHSLYKIPPYAFDAAVTTKKIRRNLSEDGGSLVLFYTMNIGGADKSARMKIWISPDSKTL